MSDSVQGALRAAIEARGLPRRARERRRPRRGHPRGRRRRLGDALRPRGQSRCRSPPGRVGRRRGRCPRRRRASTRSAGSPQRRRLEELHWVPGRILDEHLLAARAGDDVVPERESGRMQSTDDVIDRLHRDDQRFQPPASGCRPSGIGRAAELCGPASQSDRSPRSTIANAAHPLRRLEAEVLDVERGGRVDVLDEVADGRHQAFRKDDLLGAFPEELYRAPGGAHRPGRSSRSGSPRAGRPSTRS